MSPFASAESAGGDTPLGHVPGCALTRDPVAAMQRVGQGIAALHELERDRVDAVAQPRRGGAVREDVALVAVAAGAQGLDAQHAVRGVAHLLDVRLVERGVEAGPAGAALELGLVLEQRQAALATAVDAGALLTQQAAAERGLGAVMQQDAGFLGRQVGLEALAFRLGRRSRDRNRWRRVGLCRS